MPGKHMHIRSHNSRAVRTAAGRSASARPHPARIRRGAGTTPGVEYVDKRCSDMPDPAVWRGSCSYTLLALCLQHAACTRAALRRRTRRARVCAVSHQHIAWYAFPEPPSSCS